MRILKKIFFFVDSGGGLGRSDKIWILLKTLRSICWIFEIIIFNSKVFPLFNGHLILQMRHVPYFNTILFKIFNKSTKHQVFSLQKKTEHLSIMQKTVIWENFQIYIHKLSTQKGASCLMGMIYNVLGKIWHYIDINCHLHSIYIFYIHRVFQMLFNRSRRFANIWKFFGFIDKF